MPNAARQVPVPARGLALAHLCPGAFSRPAFLKADPVPTLPWSPSDLPDALLQTPG